MKFVAVFLLAAAAVAVSANPSLNDAERGGRFPCMGVGVFKITMTFDWTAARHPTAYPAGAHFSPPITATHSKAYPIWKTLGYASEGVQAVAETGATMPLFDELTAERNRNILNRKRAASPTATGVGSYTVWVRANGGKAFVSSISMLAPSPDWFTGIPMTNLCNEETGEWYENLTGPLEVYDAGTDGGMDFTSPDAPLGTKRIILPVPLFTLDVGSYTIENRTP